MMKIDLNEIYMKASQDGVDHLMSAVSGSVYIPSTAKRIEWTGEGKPPVGVPIEMKHKDATREWARPDFYAETLAWVGDKRFVTYGEKVGDLSDYLFRPIRTPEQIAAEDRLASAYAMCAIAPSLCNGDAVALYDAGYRKQVKP